MKHITGISVKRADAYGQYFNDLWYGRGFWNSLSTLQTSKKSEFGMF